MAATKTPTFVPVVDAETVAAYRAADKGDKARLRKALTEAKDAAIEALDMQAALDAKATLAACIDTPASEAAKVDPTEVVLNRARDLYRAAYMLLTGVTVPEGISEGDIDYSKFPASVEDMRATFVPVNIDAVSDDEPEAFQAAHKLASAKVTRSTERRSIAEVVARAFEGRDSGTVLKVSEIARLGAIEGYNPSQGAIGNAIKSGNLSGIEYVPADAEGPLRARLA